MEEAPENGKESSHSAHANGMSEWMNEWMNIKKAPDAVMTSKDIPILQWTNMHSKVVTSDTEVGGHYSTGYHYLTRK